MKTIHIYAKNLFTLFFFFCLGLQYNTICAQTTSIPDENFERTLIDLGIDSDGTINAQVLTSDIENVITLNVENNAISDLTGIQDFADLEILNVDNNWLTELDVSNNAQLKELYCSNYGGFANLNITSLNLSNNPNLELLYAENLFLLEDLNVKNGNNEILTVELTCEHEGEPCILEELHCVTVDDETAATNDEFPYKSWYIDADFIYSEDCWLGLPARDQWAISVYPNPAKDKLFLSSKDQNGTLSAKIFSIQGKLLNAQRIDFNDETSIDVSQLTSGIYFLNIKDENGRTEVQKFVKE